MEFDIKQIINIAEQAGKLLARYFGQTLEIVEKSTVADFKTKADMEAEALIVSELNKKYPSVNINAEETGIIDKGSEYTFAIDPLDGTNNFVLGLPNFSVSIGVLHKEEIVAGVVHLPILNLTYSAEAGKGARRNGVVLKVSGETDIRRATVAHAAGYHNWREAYADWLVKSRGLELKRILFNWSVAYDLCLVAEGKIEAMVIDDCNIFDFAAGKLIAREAGAIIVGLDGQPSPSDIDTKFIVANNAAILEKLIRQ